MATRRIFDMAQKHAVKNRRTGRGLVSWECVAALTLVFRGKKKKKKYAHTIIYVGQHLRRHMWKKKKNKTSDDTNEETGKKICIRVIAFTKKSWHFFFFLIFLLDRNVWFLRWMMEICSLTTTWRFGDESRSIFIISRYKIILNQQIWVEIFVLL